jgi:hypothetical protein
VAASPGPAQSDSASLSDAVAASPGPAQSDSASLSDAVAASAARAGADALALSDEATPALTPATTTTTAPPPGFGAEAEFLSAGAASYVSAAALSATVFVVAYADGADSGHGTARVGTVSGTAVTFGAEAEFLSADGAYYVSAAALSATQFVVAYADAADAGHGTAKVGTVSGASIAFGAEAEFLSASTNSVSAAALSATQFVVAYSDGADAGHGTAKVGTVSGTAITFGAEAEFQSAAGGAGSVSAAALSATAFVVAYRDYGDASHGTAKVGAVSGTSITFGAEAEFLPAAASYVSAAALGAGKFVVAYRDEGGSNHGKAKAGAVSGTSITFGGESEFQGVDGNTEYISAAALSADEFVVAYSDLTDSGHGTAKVGTVSGAAIAFGAEAEYNTGSTEYNAIVALGAAKFAVAFRDASDSGHGTAKVWA